MTKNNDVRELILSAISELAGAVKVTLGAKGKTILYNDNKGIDVEWDGTPFTTKDGVTVAKYVTNNNDYKRLIMDVVKNASKQTVNSSGDGTTSTMIFTEALIKKGYSLVDKGYSSWDLNKAIDEVVEELITSLDDMSTDIDDTNDNSFKLLENVATVSSNNKEIGLEIIDIIRQIGFTGTIDVKESQAINTKLSTVKGLKTNKGALAAFMYNDTRNYRYSVENAFVVVFDMIIQDIHQILPFCRATSNKDLGEAPLLIFANDVSDVALNSIKAYMMSTNKQLMIVQNDGFGDKKIDIMNDICAVTSALVIDKETMYSKRPEDYKELHYTDYPIWGYMGKCGAVIVDDFTCSVLDGTPDQEYLEACVEDIQYTLSDVDADLSKGDKNFLKKRLANLTGGISIINVGGVTEIEMKEKYYRYEDAVLAVRSAIDHGVCIGGGNTLLKLYDTYFSSYKSRTDVKDSIYDALLSIPRQLLINAGLTSQKEWMQYYDMNKHGMCLDLRNNEYVHIEDYNIYDSTLVLKDVIRNAASVAKTILSIEDISFRGILYSSLK